jgi:caa(3)-type oxidase subunit IV
MNAGPRDVALRIYLACAVALSVFTISSFAVNAYVRAGRLEAQEGFLIILGVAVVKALIVAVYFMHLRSDWGTLYFLIVPALVLATTLVVVLVPDMVVAWRQDGPPVPIVHEP